METGLSGGDTGRHRKDPAGADTPKSPGKFYGQGGG